MHFDESYGETPSTQFTDETPSAHSALLRLNAVMKDLNWHADTLPNPPVDPPEPIPAEPPVEPVPAPPSPVPTPPSPAPVPPVPEPSRPFPEPPAPGEPAPFPEPPSPGQPSPMPNPQVFQYVR
ncbi:hypothetical protein [Nocardia sp. NPDC056100]|uniref:hypothetical protein n=1 Tax=Nocardia sp. NPDC056100 TaxID=3345712 RepID=UPI0035DD5882